mmetsp:Transcript_89767/g.232739  ORF Transcript_89767/g.232739 Transcript_89767/m.232739 type:complete len:237 (+) Transcript_89767:655-1365(+)
MLTRISCLQAQPLKNGRVSRRVFPEALRMAIRRGRVASRSATASSSVRWRVCMPLPPMPSSRLPRGCASCPTSAPGVACATMPGQSWWTRRAPPRRSSETSCSGSRRPSCRMPRGTSASPCRPPRSQPRRPGTLPRRAASAACSRTLSRCWRPSRAARGRSRSSCTCRGRRRVAQRPQAARLRSTEVVAAWPRNRPPSSPNARMTSSGSSGHCRRASTARHAAAWTWCRSRRARTG